MHILRIFPSEYPKLFAHKFDLLTNSRRIKCFHLAILSEMVAMWHISNDKRLKTYFQVLSGLPRKSSHLYIKMA
jgi:hypothetical protein